MIVCGVDEAGRGPVIGPLVIAGVLADENVFTLLSAIGVKDSKKLSPLIREELYGKIISIIKRYRIIIIQPDEIDMKLQRMNLNDLEMEAAVAIVDELSPEKAIVDCPSVNIAAFSMAMRLKLTKKTALLCEHKADDRHVIVGAASILAKVTRDREIEQLHKIYGDFGSGYTSDPRTIDFIRNNHELPIFRKSWSTWKEAENKKKQLTLMSFGP